MGRQESFVAQHGVAVLAEGPPEFPGHGFRHKGGIKGDGFGGVGRECPQHNAFLGVSCGAQVLGRAAPLISFRFFGQAFFHGFKVYIARKVRGVIFRLDNLVFAVPGLVAGQICAFGKAAHHRVQVGFRGDKIKQRPAGQQRVGRQFKAVFLPSFFHKAQVFPQAFFRG